MCLINKMIVKLSEMDPLEVVDLKEMYENLSGKKYVMNDVCVAFDMDYIQAYNVFEAKDFNRRVISNPKLCNAGNALSMLTIFKICGVTTWERVDTWSVDPKKLYDTINDLTQKINDNKRSNLLDVIMQAGYTHTEALELIKPA